MLDVAINKVPQGQAFVVIEDGQVWMDVAILREAGVSKVHGDERQWNGRTLVGLASLAPGVTYELDEISLTLRLTVQASLMAGTRVDLSSRRPDGIEYRHATSAFLNYGTSVMSAGTSSVSFEGGLSVGAALFTSTGFADSTGAYRRGTDGHHVRRPAPDEPLRCRRRDCDLGRARRHGAAWRRHRLPRLLARPVLRALPDDQPERRRDDAVAGGGLRQQPARTGAATPARRLLARSPAAARRRR